jgi:hypothetical protein
VEGANPSFYWQDWTGQQVDIKSLADNTLIYSGFGN